MDRTIEQQKTKIWRDDDDMICIGQDKPYTDDPSVIVIHPVFLPHIIAWLQELLTETLTSEA